MFVFVVPTLQRTQCVAQVAETTTCTARLTSNVDESSLRNACHLRETK